MSNCVEETPRAEMSFNGKTWRDMPGNCEDNKRFNFWFYRNGLLDIHEDVECPDERTKLRQRDARRRCYGYKRQTAGRIDRNPDLSLTGSLGLQHIESMRILPETTDDLAEVKRRVRQWATEMTGHDFTQIRDVEAELPTERAVRRDAEGAPTDKRRLRKVTDIMRGAGGRFGVICKTTIPQRMEVRVAAMKAAAKLGVSLNDITTAACGTRADFLSATWMLKSDSKHYPALREFVERVERGEVTSVPRASVRCGKWDRKAKRTDRSVCLTERSAA